MVMRNLPCICCPGLSGNRSSQTCSAECGTGLRARSLWFISFLDSGFLPHTLSLSLLSLVLYRSWGLQMRVPGLGGLQKAAATRAKGLPEAQVLGLDGEGQASCYGERNITRLTCLTGGLEKYPRPSGASEPSIIWKGSFHDEGYLCG